MIIVICVSAITTLLSFLFFRRLRYTREERLSLTKFEVLIGDIAEVIIPRTCTPGAEDADVGKYIINVIENCTSPRDRRTFILGLERLENYCLSKYHYPFSKCDELTQRMVLKHFETAEIFSNPILNKIKVRIWGKAFFDQMKWLTVSGYCTSKLGATQGLAYDSIPVNYIACIPYLSNQKSWATK